MTAKLYNLLALTSLAIIGCSFGATPANALAHIPSSAHKAHANALNAGKRKRGLGKRCLARTAPTANAAAAAPTAAANAGGDPNANNGSNNSGNNNNNNNNNNGGGGGGATYSGASGSGKKVGLAWGGSPDQIKNFANGNVGAFYNWSPVIPDEVRQAGLEGVPMFWGERDIGTFQQTVVAGYANEVLGFNEPDLASQSGLDPYYAAQLWQQYIQPLKNQGYRLIGPATTSAPAGMDWYKTFLGACQGCTFDAIALHWYDVSADAFIAYVNNWHDTFGHNIWVTEFACQNFNGGAQCSNDYIPQFMAQVTGFMNSVDWVERYFAFGAMEFLPDNVNMANVLMGGDGQPTALGWQYLNGA